MSTVEVSAKDVMALRQKTGLGMMDCKKALIEHSGDAAAAETALREKMKGKMDTRVDRAAGVDHLDRRRRRVVAAALALLSFPLLLAPPPLALRIARVRVAADGALALALLLLSGRGC